MLSEIRGKSRSKTALSRLLATQLSLARTPQNSTRANARLPLSGALRERGRRPLGRVLRDLPERRAQQAYHRPRLAAPNSASCIPVYRRQLCDHSPLLPGPHTLPARAFLVSRWHRQSLGQETARPIHSITSSVRASSEEGTERPSALAVLRYDQLDLSELPDGKSASFSPLRMRPV